MVWLSKDPKFPQVTQWFLFKKNSNKKLKKN